MTPSLSFLTQNSSSSTFDRTEEGEKTKSDKKHILSRLKEKARLFSLHLSLGAKNLHRGRGESKCMEPGLEYLFVPLPRFTMEEEFILSERESIPSHTHTAAPELPLPIWWAKMSAGLSWWTQTYNKETNLIWTWKGYTVGEGTTVSDYPCCSIL